jgi:broad specificity phosphatase PhoE
VQTAEPIARIHGLAVEIVDDLRERLLATAVVEDWYAMEMPALNELEVDPRRA